jgi:hypothetical protein
MFDRLGTAIVGNGTERSQQLRLSTFIGAIACFRSLDARVALVAVIGFLAAVLGYLGLRLASSRHLAQQAIAGTAIVSTITFLPDGLAHGRPPIGPNLDGGGLAILVGVELAAVFLVFLIGLSRRRRHSHRAP